MQLLNFGTERSRCSEEMVGSQRNENYLGTSQGFHYSESFHKECSRKQGNAGGGTPGYPQVLFCTGEERVLSAVL